MVPLDTVTGSNSNYFIATIFLFVRRHTGKINKRKENRRSMYKTRMCPNNGAFNFKNAEHTKKGSQTGPGVRKFLIPHSEISQRILE